MKKILLTFFLLTFAFIVSKTIASADGCETIYGGGEMCNPNVITIQKTVLNPQTNKFVTNLGKNDAVYHPSDIITFQIKVTNVSKNTLSMITIKDIFPDYVNYTSGPGTFDKAAKNFTGTIPTLKPNDVATVTILGRIVLNDQITSKELIPCVTNRSLATTTDNQTFYASSQFCIEKRSSVANALPAPTNANRTPATGPEALPLLALIPTAGAGLWLRRKSR